MCSGSSRLVANAQLSLSLFPLQPFPSVHQRHSALCYSSSSLVYSILFLFLFLFLSLFVAVTVLFFLPPPSPLPLFFLCLFVSRLIWTRRESTWYLSGQNRMIRANTRFDDEVSLVVPHRGLSSIREGLVVPVSSWIPLKAPGDIYKVSRGIFLRSPAISSSGSIGILHELFIESSAIVYRATIVKVEKKEKEKEKKKGTTNVPANISDSGKCYVQEVENRFACVCIIWRDRFSPFSLAKFMFDR